jgi:hypothetical protein
MKQRIALVAVSALTAGLFSVVSAPVANAAGGDLVVIANAATTTSSRGIISTNGTAGTSGLSASAVTTNYGVLLSSGSIYATSAALAVAHAFKVSGGTISECTGGAGTAVLNTARTSCTGSEASTLAITAAPNSDATSMSVTTYTTAAATTAQGGITYSIVAAATANKFSASTSFISAELTAVAATNNIDATNTDTTGTAYSGTIVPAGVSGYLGYDLKDAYGTQLSAHVLGASVTGGCLVGFNQAAAANTYTASSTATAVGYITVSRVTSTSAYTCTLTLTDNGVTVASRTYTLLGQAASITVTGLKRVKTGAAANDDAMEVNVFDSAGNAIDNASFSVVSSYLNSGLTSITADRGSDRDGELGDADVTCITSGTYDFAMQVTNASLATITSPVYKLSCSGSPDSFTAGLDKASYAPGEIATLTITAKDSKGNLTNDYAVLGTAGAAATEASLTGGMLTVIGATTAALLNAIKFTNGVAKFKFTVGATEGSYNLVVDLPAYPTAAGANQAQTVSYKVASATGTVSNAQVLQSIVALIASINKQIQALQKLILARR